jgi:hypothetical protein
MDTTASQGALGDIAEWQAVLDGAGDRFDTVRPGARMGILPLGDGAAPVTQVNTDLLVWAAGPAGMRARRPAFAGFPLDGIDLLFAAEDEVLAEFAAACRAPGADPLTRLIERVNDGRVMLFYLKERDALEALGYEALFDRLGITFMGPCR